MVKQNATRARGFYILIALVALAGVVFIGTMASRSSTPQVREVGVTPGPAQGYLLGDANAPVQVLEFADFECPACGQFSLVTEPDVRQRLIQTGKVSYRYFDYPLKQHRNSLVASLAAACANDQGKFWQMHDALFFNQPEWSSESTSDPMKYFAGYAKQIGLDVDAWKQCVSEQRHLATILGNREEGNKVGVAQTPTFVIGKKLVVGAVGYDEFRAHVDSATPPAPAPAPANKKSK
jgi:protein-disulfide isomerase